MATGLGPYVSTMQETASAFIARAAVDMGRGSFFPFFESSVSLTGGKMIHGLFFSNLLRTRRTRSHNFASLYCEGMAQKRLNLPRIGHRTTKPGTKLCMSTQASVASRCNAILTMSGRPPISRWRGSGNASCQSSVMEPDRF